MFLENVYINIGLDQSPVNPDCSFTYVNGITIILRLEERIHNALRLQNTIKKY